MNPSKIREVVLFYWEGKILKYKEEYNKYKKRQRENITIDSNNKKTGIKR